MKNSITLLIIICSYAIHAQTAQVDLATKLEGNWMGIDMYQDQESYDGKNYFLPNEEFLVIDKEKIRIYFYPYSKSDEFKINIVGNTIKYKVGRKNLETDFSFTSQKADTLIFTMHFINKTFVKMYSRVTSINQRMEIDHATLNELDVFGFNPSSVTHEMELDTFHKELYLGFDHPDSLPFKPYDYLQFISDESFVINRLKPLSFNRGYKTIKFIKDGREEEFKISHSEGTQSLTIIPVSQCQCDSIHIPYLTVSWADRIRKDMKENAYKYRN